MSIYLIFYILIGVGLGVVADRIFRSRSVGLSYNILLGGAGAGVGAWAIGSLGFTFQNDQTLMTVLAAVFCSVLALLLGVLFKSY